MFIIDIHACLHADFQSNVLCSIDIFIHHKMIVSKKIQSKNKGNTIDTIKQIYKRHFYMNVISQEISYDFVRDQCTEVQNFKLKLCTTVINTVDIACLKQFHKQTVDNKIQ